MSRLLELRQLPSEGDSHKRRREQLVRALTRLELPDRLGLPSGEASGRSSMSMFSSRQCCIHLAASLVIRH